ncbi:MULTISPECIES: PTS sugar transporter subunit IIB [Lactobacillus]|uniref:PTS ascorbate transporter subunit IIB n=1 Tax=Lactobacillus kullabergensis TaxID=1218493 RepID=A0ABN5LHN7_9LACO|nr:MULTISPECIES: PTS sugar transporter subunit IIB [Lactobacillus]AWM76201.1 PTS ascorbate transporter subunit IIB [Lactobacillus kullabergensis]MBC6370339.1 PTS sugar transporter subunit IIB [Lactobacillus kullabergensis]RMC52808.1 PTS sugar transporter subunit IIB [Lactobacillus sp. ESL0261]
MKILAVCGFGVGSSMVLKMTLEKAVKELGIDAEVKNTDIASAKAEQADVYFTSAELKPDLESSTDKPVYAIKRYMDKDEVLKAMNAFLANKKGN